tara:strand:+ start:482 stop:682 length:201 start_codon:yes stop_codon:yes gene_type:complete
MEYLMLNVMVEDAKKHPKALRQSSIINGHGQTITEYIRVCTVTSALRTIIPTAGMITSTLLMQVNG